MPFLQTDPGRAYYRHWAAPDPRAAVVFLHGFGEHTGLYHRYGFALNAAGIDLWAVDQLGHGLTPGTRGDFGTLADSSALAEALTVTVERERPGLPLIAAGHSFGSVVTLLRLVEQPKRYRAGVISEAPLAPIADLLDADTSLDLDPSWLSTDPFYLDALENDPLGFTRRRTARPWRGRWMPPGTGSAPNSRHWRCQRWRCTASAIRSRPSVRCGPTPSRSPPCRSPNSPAPSTTSSTNPCTARSAAVGD